MIKVAIGLYFQRCREEKGEEGKKFGIGLDFKLEGGEKIKEKERKQGEEGEETHKNSKCVQQISMTCVTLCLGKLSY